MKEYLLPDIFGKMVFNDKIMKTRLEPSVYKAYLGVREDGRALEPKTADAIANAMKDWALENGATHYSHWFQPLTGITAEKHDCFITPVKDAAGEVIMNFSGKELIRGESDASSLPSGGLRSTFEARGYTAWDTQSFAFIKDGVLCIPSAFFSYSGEALDKKTPLLRSVCALEKAVLSFLSLLGSPAKKITVTVGCEQEYFLVDKAMFDKRKDLISTGRTLLGAKPVKGQELEDHYFGTIKPRVLKFMQELDTELWKLGILAKTRHNESAPAQHELAPVFTSVNTAADHNQLTMEIMKKVAGNHGLACLLNEKPFKGVNGSGKHNNWSVCTDKGENLLDPTKSPETNYKFLLFLCAFIKAVDDRQDLLRASCATAGNDRRLGGEEAPPAIISIYLGDELSGILESLGGGKAFTRKQDNKNSSGTNGIIADFMRDTADRNRTSPFAFTGNKFEFRMLGSSMNAAEPNTIINAAVADALNYICGELKKDNSPAGIKALISKIYLAHKRILFSGNNYSPEWRKEARERGLLNLPSTADALPYFTKEKNVELLENLEIYSLRELRSRQEILADNYVKVLNIEALTLLSMASKEVLPAALKYQTELCDGIIKKTSLNFIKAGCESEKALLLKISGYSDALYSAIQNLEKALEYTNTITDSAEKAAEFSKTVYDCMERVREHCDALESVVAKKHWPFPTYSELLFSV